MAFPKKTWKDRVSEQPQRRLITPVGGGTATTVDVTRQEGIVIQEGDAFSAANMNDLENRIKTTLDTDEASISTINTKATTNANNIASLQNNVNTLMSIKAPNYHASPTATFGMGKPNEFGHLKISDGAYEGNAAAGVAASSNLVGVVNDKVDAIQNELTANGNRIYMDYQGGKYGYNTSANRGADTFHPFNSASILFPFSMIVKAFHSDGDSGVLYPCSQLTGYRLMTSGINTLKITFSSTAVDVAGTRSLVVKNPSGATISTAFDSNINVAEYDYVIIDYTSGSWGAETTDTVTFSQVN